MISTLLSPFAVTNPYVADLYPDQYKLPREAGSWLRAGVESLSTPPPKRQGCNAQLPTPCCSSRSLLAGGARWSKPRHQPCRPPCHQPPPCEAASERM